MNSLLRGTKSNDLAAVLQKDISPEIQTSFTFLKRVLGIARKVLLADCQAQLCKSVASSLDELLFATIAHPNEAFANHSHPHALTETTRKQFEFDMSVLTSLFESFVSKPKKHLRKLSDVRNLFNLEASKVREVRNALDENEGSNGMEQISTILEVCHIYTMTPEQVFSVCNQILDRD